MKSKLITIEKFNNILIENTNEYNIIVFLLTIEQWNDPNYTMNQYFDKSKILDFDGSVGINEYNKCLINNISKLSQLSQVSELSELSEQKVILIGLGNEKDCNINTFRKCVYNGICNVLNKNVEKICIYVDIQNIAIPKKLQQYVDNIVMICTLSNYKFNKYTSNKLKLNQIDYNFGNLTVLNQKLVIDTLNRSFVMSKQTNNARNLINDRGSQCNPDFIENYCRDISSKYSFTMKVIKGQQLVDERMNLFYSVGKGSRFEPRLILIEYFGNKSTNKIQYSLVGKGITFDTGGYHLKPKGSIEAMYIDMSGAAVVLSVLRGLKELNVKVNVVVAMCIAENVINNKSYLPNDIYISRKGYSVEISNTDAEGRLVMADTLTYVQDIYEPNIIIDIATLTGGCITALGESIAGIFGNNEYIINKIIQAGTFKYERCWHLPIFEEHYEAIKGDESDLKSMGTFNGASALIAGAFLGKFINKNVKWVHIDIAGPSKLETIKNWQYKSGTGFGVGLLLQYFINECK